MYIIGLTGGIATGKSTVARYLAELYISIIDSDILARQALIQGREAYLAVVAHFGERIVNEDGSINRRDLGKLIFNDEEQRLVLEKIVHKQVLKDINVFLSKYRTLQEQLVIIDIPLLFEVEWSYLCDEVWVVVCGAAQQRERLMLRDDLKISEIEARIASQMPLSKKISLADVVLDNSGSQRELFQQIDERLSTLVADGKLS